jgi:hypothetical protein
MDGKVKTPDGRKIFLSKRWIIGIAQLNRKSYKTPGMMHCGEKKR